MFHLSSTNFVSRYDWSANEVMSTVYSNMKLFSQVFNSDEVFNSNRSTLCLQKRIAAPIFQKSYLRFIKPERRKLAVSDLSCHS